MYAIVDIETTGSYAAAHGITEIAIILHNGVTEEGRYETLVRPQQPIPRHITALTGISQDMVDKAPAFDELAERVHRLLENRVFVAHNVNFDYSFLKFQLEAAGFSLKSKKLCTVRLARKILPGFTSYSLGTLCRSLGISIAQRHRAMGDAEATCTVFNLLLRSDTQGIVQGMLKAGNRDTYLPMHLPAASIENLPHSPGVYYFHDQKGKVVYVGKATNLRRRVTSHFSNNQPSRRKQELIRNVYQISFQVCGSSFMASVVESLEIKRLWPVYNAAQKRFEFSYALCSYEDRSGFLQLGILRRRKQLSGHYGFNQLSEGHAILRRMIREETLCPRLCTPFLETEHCREPAVEGQKLCNACPAADRPQEYNQQVKKSMEKLLQDLPTFLLVDEGRTRLEKSCLLVEKGIFYGLGYLHHEEEIPSLEELKTKLTPYPSNEALRAMILKEALVAPEKVVHFTS